MPPKPPPRKINERIARLAKQSRTSTASSGVGFDMLAGTAAVLDVPPPVTETEIDLDELPDGEDFSISEEYEIVTDEELADELASIGDESGTVEVEQPGTVTPQPGDVWQSAETGVVTINADGTLTPFVATSTIRQSIAPVDYFTPDPSSTVITISLPVEIIRTLESQLAPGQSLRQLIAARLSSCRSHLAEKPLYLDDEQRRIVERAMDRNFDDGSELAAEIVNSYHLTGPVLSSVHPDPALIERVRDRMWGDESLAEKLQRLFNEAMERETGLL